MRICGHLGTVRVFTMDYVALGLGTNAGTAVPADPYGMEAAYIQYNVQAGVCANVLRTAALCQPPDPPPPPSTRTQARALSLCD
jgi:hypothetical protein